MRSIIQFTEEDKQGVIRSIRSAFADVFLIPGVDMNAALHRMVDDFHRQGTAPLTDDRVKFITGIYFPTLVSNLTTAKKNRSALKRDSTDGTPGIELSSLENQVKQLHDEMDQVKLLIKAVIVAICDRYPHMQLMKMRSTEQLLQRHKDDELFSNLPSTEADLLLVFRNYLRIGLALIPYYRNENTLMRIAARLEGRQAEYIRGNGATKETRRRLAIYHHEVNLIKAKENRVINPNTRKRSLRSYGTFLKSLIRMGATKASSSAGAAASASSSSAGAATRKLVSKTKGAASSVKSHRSNVVKPVRQAVNMIRFMNYMKAAIAKDPSLLGAGGDIDLDLFELFSKEEFENDLPTLFSQNSKYENDQLTSLLESMQDDDDELTRILNEMGDDL